MRREWIVGAGVAAFALLVALAGCRYPAGNELRVGVTPGPSEDILESVRDDLRAQGVKLKVIPFTDYIQPNLALASRDIDANLYQNPVFLEQYNRDHGTTFVAVQRVYLPLMALYPGKVHALTALGHGARIGLPNDPVNYGRALRLLEGAGLLVLKRGAGLNPTADDIAANPRTLTLVQLDAAQLARSRDDLDAAVINANFALNAGLNPHRDALFSENANSRFGNVLVVNRDVEHDARVAKLAAALHAEKTQAFIRAHYEGALYPQS